MQRFSHRSETAESWVRLHSLGGLALGRRALRASRFEDQWVWSQELHRTRANRNSILEGKTQDLVCPRTQGKMQWPHKSRGQTCLLLLEGFLWRCWGGRVLWLTVGTKILSAVVLGSTHWHEPSWRLPFFHQDLAPPRDQTQVYCIAGKFFTIWATREPLIKYIMLLFLCFASFCFPWESFSSNFSNFLSQTLKFFYLNESS